MGLGMNASLRESLRESVLGGWGPVHQAAGVAHLFERIKATTTGKPDNDPTSVTSHLVQPLCRQLVPFILLYCRLLLLLLLVAVPAAAASRSCCGCCCLAHQHLQLLRQSHQVLTHCCDSSQGVSIEGGHRRTCVCKEGVGLRV